MKEEKNIICYERGEKYNLLKGEKNNLLKGKK